MVVLVVEPKNIDLAVLLVLDNKIIHRTLVSFSESQFFAIDSLLVSYGVLLVLLPRPQFFLVVNDNLHFLGKSFRGPVDLKGFGGSRVSQARVIFYFCEATVRY